MSKARQPASQPTPHWPAASPEPSSHSTLRIEPSDGHDHVDVERGAVGQRGAGARGRSRRPRATSPRRRCAGRRRASRCISAAIRPITPPSAPTSGASPRSATVTARPSSRQTEATSEPMKPAPTTRTRPGRRPARSRSPAASSRVRMREHAVQRGLRRVEPGPGAHAGGDQQAVVRDLLAVGQAAPAWWPDPARSPPPRAATRRRSPACAAASCGRPAPTRAGPASTAEGGRTARTARPR